MKKEVGSKYGIRWEDSLLSKGEDENIRRLDRFFSRAERGEKVTFLALGGSITEGYRSSAPERSYSSLVSSWLKETFPEADLTYVNAGIGGTGSIYCAYRMERDEAAYRPDLVILDCSVNDIDSPIAEETYEGVVRRLYLSPFRPAVICLGNVRYDNGESAQASHARVARHYGIPFISMATTLYRAVLLGKILPRDFTPDDLHPNDLGHSLLAEGIIHYLKRAYRAYQVKKKEGAKEAAKAPVPDKFTWQAGDALLIPGRLTEDSFYSYQEPSVKAKGFQRLPGARENIQDRFREGWTADKEGDSILFTGEGRSITVIYRQVMEKTDMSPRVTAVVDGDISHALTLDGWFSEDWGEKIEIVLAALHLPEGVHSLRLTVTKTHENDTKPFLLLGVGFSA